MAAKNRRFITLILGLVILFSQGISASAQAQTYTATPSADNTTLNGSPATMQAYKINGSNYVKLRDFASMVNGTPQNFEVTWDGGLNAISMYTRKPYTAVGGEGTPIGTEEKQAADTTSAIYVNGQQVSLKGYNISNNNYFKLRDLGNALEIGIDWDNTSKTVIVDSVGTGEQGSAEAGQPVTADGNYVLTPEQEEYLQQTLATLGSPKMAERIEAGWRTTLDPSDPNHPGWNKNGSFELGTLKPGQEPPPAPMYGYAGCVTHGEAVARSWEGIVVNGG